MCFQNKNPAPKSAIGRHKEQHKIAAQRWRGPELHGHTVQHTGNVGNLWCERGDVNCEDVNDCDLATDSVSYKNNAQ